MKITQVQWEILSDKMVRITRVFNEERPWRGWSTGAWRMESDEALNELLQIIGVEVEY